MFKIQNSKQFRTLEHLYLDIARLARLAARQVGETGLGFTRLLRICVAFRAGILEFSI